MHPHQRRALTAIFANSVRANIVWDDVVSLLAGLGAEIDTGAAGSRVFVVLNGVRLLLHKPHPGKEIKRYVVRALRDFLTNAGVAP